jgi:hypothetical protein
MATRTLTTGPQDRRDYQGFSAHASHFSKSGQKKSVKYAINVRSKPRPAGPVLAPDPGLSTRADSNRVAREID